MIESQNGQQDDQVRVQRAKYPPLVEPSAWHHVELRVNAQPVVAQVESRLLLSDFLRHRLGLTGTHVGCEQGSCGSCTVLIDGKASRSCLTFAVQCADSEVTTVESMTDDDRDLHPIQQAFHDCHGMQCGFCTPGILMSLLELSEGEEKPDEEAMMDQLGGHLCRCTGYVNIRNAARCGLGMSGPVPDGASHHD